MHASTYVLYRRPLFQLIGTYVGRGNYYVSYVGRLPNWMPCVGSRDWRFFYCPRGRLDPWFL